MNLSVIFLTTNGSPKASLLCPTPSCASLLSPIVITYPPAIVKAEWFKDTLKSTTFFFKLAIFFCKVNKHLKKANLKVYSAYKSLNFVDIFSKSQSIGIVSSASINRAIVQQDDRAIRSTKDLLDVLDVLSQRDSQWNQRKGLLAKSQSTERIRSPRI